MVYTGAFDLSLPSSTDVKASSLTVVRKTTSYHRQFINRVKSSVLLRSKWNESELADALRQLGIKSSAPPLKTIGPASLQGMTGAEIFHEMMVRHEVKYLFTYSGGAIVPIYDAIQNTKKFQMILPRHEQGAGHMAEGYAKASGKPGVLLVTAGPGATNVITPLQDAFSDGVPLVAFSGQVPLNVLGTDAFQEVDIIGLSKPCTKWNIMVQDIRDLPRIIEEAFYTAMSGRPGPVLVALPKNISMETLERKIKSHFKAPRRTKSFNELRSHCQTIAAIHRVSKLINKAQRPVIYVGNGILNSPGGAELLKQLSHTADIPVTTTIHALGVIDEHDKRSLKMLGMHGCAAANLAMQHADVIIALGSRFDDRVTGDPTRFAPAARLAEKQGMGGIIQFEILPRNINKIITVTEAVRGDVGQNLRTLLPLIKHNTHPDWFKTIDSWREKFPLIRGPSTGKSGRLRPQHVLAELDSLTSAYKNKLLFTTGVGNHQMFTAQYITWRNPSFLTSGGQGTMGFGIPAAIGAKLAYPDKMVIDVDGDGSFSMTCMEIATAVQFGVNIKVLLLNNECHGMVKQAQDLFFNGNSGVSRLPGHPDFLQLVDSMGCKALRCSDPSTLTSKLEEFLAYNDGPVVLETEVDMHEQVYPMVPPGKALHEMLVHGGVPIDFSN